MEEMMTNTMEEIVNEDAVMFTEIDSNQEVINKSKGGLVAKVILTVTAAIGAGFIAWKASEEKRETKAIKRLEKKGYRVTKIEDEAVTHVTTPEFSVVSEDEEDEE